MEVRRRSRACAVALVLTLTGCGGSQPAAPAPTGEGSRATGTPSAPGTTPPSSGTSATTRAAATGVPGTPSDVVTRLDVPWSVAPLPDGSALVSLRDEARLVRVSADGEVAPVRATGEDGRIPDVVPAGEGGLLGVATSPEFVDDRLVYLYLTAADGNRIVRAPLRGDRLGEPEVLVPGIPAAQNHNGGRIAFGPDGMLYAGTGDAGSPQRAQDPDSPAGKILRVTPEGEPAPGNPDPGSPVWSLGHRNVQGLGWDAEGRMFASEFGSDELDELNLIEPGRNYGWPAVEGPGGGDELTDPLVTWPPAEASPSGVLVTGDAVYLAALRGERLWRVPLDDGEVGEPEAYLEGELGRLRDVVLGPGREALWLLTNNTARGDPRPGDDRLVRVPLT